MDEELRDRAAIAGLLHAYCRLVDENRPRDVVELFTPHAVFDYGFGRVFVGTASLVEMLTAGLARSEATSHLLGNIEIDVQQDGAQVRSVVHAWHRRVGGEEVHLWGRYTDEVVRDGGGRWRFASRVLRAAGERHDPPRPMDEPTYERLPRA